MDWDLDGGLETPVKKGSKMRDQMGESIGASQTQMSEMSKAMTVASEVKQLSMSDGDEIPSDMEDSMEDQFEMGSSESSDDIDKESNLIDSQNPVEQLKMMTPRPEAIALEMDTDDDISSENEQEMEVASESSSEDEMEDIPAIKSIDKDSNS